MSGSGRTVRASHCWDNVYLAWSTFAIFYVKQTLWKVLFILCADCHGLWIIYKRQSCTVALVFRGKHMVSLPAHWYSILYTSLPGHATHTWVRLEIYRNFAPELNVLIHIVSMIYTNYKTVISGGIISIYMAINVHIYRKNMWSRYANNRYIYLYRLINNRSMRIHRINKDVRSKIKAMFSAGICIHYFKIIRINNHKIYIIYLVRYHRDITKLQIGLQYP